MSEEWLYQATSTQAELDIARRKIELLEQFYRNIVELTINHDFIESKDGHDYASVSPQKLGDLLAKVDPEWFKH